MFLQNMDMLISVTETLLDQLLANSTWFAAVS